MFGISIRANLAKAQSFRTALGYSTKHITPSHIRHLRPLFRPIHSNLSMAKRKSSTLAQEAPTAAIPNPPPAFDDGPPPKRRASQRKPSATKASTNPNINANVLDAPGALRASPDADEPDERMNLEGAGMDVDKQVKNEDEDEVVASLANGADSDSSLSDMSDVESPVKAKPSAKGGKAKIPAKAKTNGVLAEQVTPKQVDSAKAKKEPSKGSQFLDPEDDGIEEADEEEIQAALSRPPPVNSDYLPLPWKGRIGYVCQPNNPSITLLTFTGLPLHLPSLLQSSSLYITNLPYSLDTGKPAPPPRPQRATAPD